MTFADQGRWLSVRLPRQVQHHISAGEVISLRVGRSRVDMLIENGAADTPLVSTTGRQGGPHSSQPRHSTPSSSESVTAGYSTGHLGVGDCVWVELQLCRHSARFAVRLCWRCRGSPRGVSRCLHVFFCVVGFVLLLLVCDTCDVCVVD